MKGQTITDRDIDNFQTILVTRMLIVANGLKIRLKDLPMGQLRDLSEACYPSDTDEPIPDPFRISWNLYEIDVGSNCPIHRLTMPEWLVAGMLAATGNPKFCPSNVDPEAWFHRIEITMAQTHRDLITPEVRHLVQWIQEGQQDSQEDFEAVREAIKEKVAGLAEVKRNMPPHIEQVLELLASQGRVKVVFIP